MKNKVVGRKFGRVRSQRKALMRSLATNLIRDEKIKTTEAKAKELRPYIEKIITRGMKENLLSRRMLIAKIGSDSAKKVIETIAPKYKDRTGGYIRITKLPARLGDAASMAVIEFV